MSSQDSSPAKRQGELLVALGNHIAQHELPQVFVDPTGDLQVWADVPARDVLRWAKTIGATEVTISQHGPVEKRQTTVRANGTVAGHKVRVWDVEDGDLWRWLPGAGHATRNVSSITLQQLADYVAAGSVDAAVSA